MKISWTNIFVFVFGPEKNIRSSLTTIQLWCVSNIQSSVHCISCLQFVGGLNPFWASKLFASLPARGGWVSELWTMLNVLLLFFLMVSLNFFCLWLNFLNCSAWPRLNCSAWPRLELNTKMGLNHTPPHPTTLHYTTPLGTFRPLLDQLESWNLAHTLTRPTWLTYPN